MPVRTPLKILVRCGVLSCTVLLVIAVASVHAWGKGTPMSPSLPNQAPARDFPALSRATPEPDLMYDPDVRLARPPMSDPPTQVEQGHNSYYLSCMVCHGDRGQGLTDEWRGVVDSRDQNLWQSKCHAPNHPPEGFEIPRKPPPVMGADALAAYPTAADLFEYIGAEMPWPCPGHFEDEEYWQLAAYLADANQIDFEQPMGAHNAANILLVPQLIQTNHSAIEAERPIAAVVIALLIGAAVLQRWARQ